ncbi:MAG: DUF4294 domain-containing protein [Bacteroidales bacterium]|nr:MAG: DUF4294 domain-containing protein [Bacteroidales bacterium]
MNKIFAILISIIFIPTFDGLAQQTVIIDGFTIPAITTINGEPIPNWLIPEIVVFPKRTFKTKKDYRHYQRMIRNLKTVYPYARIAKDKLKDMNSQLTQLKTKREREQFVNQIEKEIRNDFEKKLMSLTVSQGKMLIKLIDRETGRTSYQLLRELKGNFSAGLWQAVARIFGSNLKSEFDEEGEDKILNELIILYEHRQL